ncbi:MAG: methyltransferase domain-containing protein [Lautropia sp.]|nr:methyltransferase domain-containing protein [Lautropia sp.]
MEPHGLKEEAPSDWVARWLPEPSGPGRLLDFACGAGRHARLAAGRGFRVLALDRDPACLALDDIPGIEARTADLESATWDFVSERFSVIVVTRYLFRSRLDLLAGLLAEGGWLIYETFAAGNGRYGKPSNPAFLLQSDELLTLARRAALQVCAFEQGIVRFPRPALVQRIAARRGGGPANLDRR